MAEGMRGKGVRSTAGSAVNAFRQTVRRILSPCFVVSVLRRPVRRFFFEGESAKCGGGFAMEAKNNVPSAGRASARPEDHRIIAGADIPAQTVASSQNTRREPVSDIPRKQPQQNAEGTIQQTIRQALGQMPHPAAQAQRASGENAVTPAGVHAPAPQNFQQRADIPRQETGGYGPGSSFFGSHNGSDAVSHESEAAKETPQNGNYGGMGNFSGSQNTGQPAFNNFGFGDESGSGRQPKNKTAIKGDGSVSDVFAALLALFTKGRGASKPQSKDKDPEEERYKKFREPTPEEIDARKKKEARRKKIINISIASALVCLTAAIGIFVYFQMHVFDRDISRCELNAAHGDYEIAYRYCKKASKIESPNSWYYLGKILEDGTAVPEEDFKFGGSVARIKAASRYFEKAAKKGHAVAAAKLGDDRANGTATVTRDPNAAIGWYEIAAKQGDVASTHKLADLLVEVGRNQDAINWLKEIGEEGDEKAASKLAEIYFSGTLAPADPTEAFKWCEKSARAGNPADEHLLSLMYRTGAGTERDLRKSFAYERMAAAAGNTEAAYGAGYMYEHGLGTEVSYPNAAAMYRRAADQGHPEAAFKLGTFYEAGIGATSDYDEAAGWYERAVTKDHAGAEYALAILNREGLISNYDRTKAVELLKRAAVHEMPEAYFYLGLSYADGVGVEKNKSEAAYWLGKAANSGFAPADYRLGLMLYADGAYDGAAKHFKNAMSAGHAYSAAYLGIMAAMGQGTPKSEYMAYYYFLVSNMLYPAPNTEMNIDLLRSRLSDEQTGIAQDRAEQFVRKVQSGKSAASSKGLLKY